MRAASENALAYPSVADKSWSRSLSLTGAGRSEAYSFRPANASRASRDLVGVGPLSSFRPANMPRFFAGSCAAGAVAQHLKLQHRFLIYQELIRAPYLQHCTLTRNKTLALRYLICDKVTWKLEHMASQDEPWRS
jgi:hypothetical protein